MRKLCSALVTYFIRSPVPWHRPIQELAIGLSNFEAIQGVGSPHRATPVFAGALEALPDQEMTALLWFAEILAEDVSRLPVKQQAYARHHANMLASLEDMSAVLQWALGPEAEQTLKEQALPAYASWVNYAQDIQLDVEGLRPLRAFVRQVSDCLTDEALAPEAMAILRDRLDCYSDFFLPEAMEHLASIVNDHIRPRLQRALANQDADSYLLVQFIVAFGCANIQQIVEDPNHELGSRAIVKILMDVLTIDGIPGDSDDLAIHTIEFWNTYIEFINDTVYSLDPDEQQPPWVAYAKSILNQTVGLLWNKLWIPPASTSKSWGDQEHDAFKEFRLDSTDLMLSIFAFLGKDMLHQLVSFALQSLQIKKWRGVEASLFALNTLSDNVLEDGATEEAIEALFRSDLFVQVADFNQTISSQTRRTAIDTLGSYGQYIERHPEFLPDTVRFLFASLEMGGLANAAAKSIDSLCSTCRTNLTHEVPGFLTQYEKFLESPTNDPYTKQKIIGGIASIIQALTPESAKAEPLLALLANIETDVAAAKEHASVGETEMTELIGVSALECLTCVGKGLQVPDDVPIDVYDEDEQNLSEGSFWHTEEGHAIQQRIIGCFSVLQVVGTYSEAIDAACQVLRSGFAETQPGPFVLPPAVTVNFVQQCSLNTPQLESVLGTASMLITSSSRRGFKLSDEDATALYSSVRGFAQTLGQSTNDPTVASECIGMLTRLMPSYTHILFEHITEALLDFTLSAIDATETFPKRSACEFWTKVIKPQTEATSEDSKQRIAQVMASFGPKLVFTLVQQIGGKANRSDLDILCEPLKALLLHQSGTQVWMQQALSDDRFHGQRLDMEGRAKFLRHLLSARSDGRVVKDAVKTFWAACRGTVVSFS